MDTGAMATPPSQLIWPMSAMSSSKVVMTMWPASMFAKRRIMSANGFVNMLRISTGIMMGSSHAGRPGGIRLWKCPTTPYFEIPAYCCAAKDTRARPIVTARLPVEVAEKGMRPSSAATRMKEKKLHSSGVNWRPSSWPMLGSAMSSRMKSTSALDRGAEAARDLPPAVAAHREPRDQDHERRRGEEEDQVLRGQDERSDLQGAVRGVVHDDRRGVLVPRLGAVLGRSGGVRVGVGRRVGRGRLGRVLGLRGRARGGLGGVRGGGLQEQGQQQRAHRPAPPAPDGAAGVVVRRWRIVSSMTRKRTK